MAFVCAISGEVPQVPMVSVKSGEIFEQRLLEQYVKEHSKHPVSGETCAAEDFVAMAKTLHVQPRVPTQTSIPSILKLMQDEYDAMSIENYTLRQQLQQVRQELSRALYQHDAACRVIARLTRERDQARNIAQDLNPQAAHAAQQQAQKNAGNGDASMEVDGEAQGTGSGKLTAEMVTAIKIKSDELCQWRKNKEADADLAEQDAFTKYTVQSSYPGLHGAKGVAVTALALSALDSDAVISGGNDKAVVITSQKDGKIVHKFKSAHTKKVLDVLAHPSKSLIYSCSADKQVKVFDIESKAAVADIKAHSGEVTSLDMHPSERFILSTSLDGSWALSDTETNEVLMVEEGQGKLTCGKFHPDGLYMATGADNGNVLIWDMERQTVAHAYDGHDAAVNSMSFSENGRYIATSSVDGVVKIWDLVKLKHLHTIQPEDGQKVNAVSFDQSGQYLVAAGTVANVYLVKKKTVPLLHSFTDVPEISKVAFGPHAATIVAACVDRSIKVIAA